MAYWVGPQWTAYTGQSVRTNEGRGWLEGLHPSDLDVALQAWSQAGVNSLYQTDFGILYAGTGTTAVLDLQPDDEAWATPSRQSAAPKLHLAGFDGPADLLLDRAERRRIGLGWMSMLELAERFGAALEQLRNGVVIEHRADWLVVAAPLVRLRSRLLLTATPDAVAEAERDAVVELARLAEPVRMRAGWSEASAAGRVASRVLSNQVRTLSGEAPSGATEFGFAIGSSSPVASRAWPLSPASEGVSIRAACWRVTACKPG